MEDIKTLVSLICDMNKDASNYWNRKLLENERALSYLEDRGISDSTIQRFNIGYAEKDNLDLYCYLSKKYSEEDLVYSGLFLRLSDGYIDRFRDRIMFPVIIETGKTVGFSGRVIDDAFGSLAKYMNSPVTYAYNKSRILYGLNLSRPWILYQKYAILVEGNLDVASLYQNGIQNVVASCGTAFTDWMAKRLYCLTNEVVIADDPDDAGKKARKKAEEILKANNMIVKHIELPNGLDPDKFIRKFGKEKFLKLIRKN